MKTLTVEREGTTKVSTCSCDHPYQDKKYGKGKRLFNAKADKVKHEGRCTICEKVKQI